MVRTRLTPKVPIGQPLPTSEGGLDYDDLIVDEIYGPLEYTIRASTQQKHCDMLNIHHPFFEKELNLFPWNYTTIYRAATHWKGVRLNQAIAAESHYRFYKPAKVGDRLFAQAILVDKFELRGRHYIVFEESCRDANNDLVATRRSRIVTMVGRSELPNRGEQTKARQNENWWQGAATASVPANSPDQPIGLELPNYVSGPAPMRVSGFKEWDPEKWKKNIHGDEYARRLGYSKGVIEAPVATEFGLLNSLVSFFGPEQFFNTGQMQYKVAGPVYVGDVLVGKLRIRERRKEGPYVRTIVDTRIEKEDGTMCQIGTANALDRVPVIED